MTLRSLVQLQVQCPDSLESPSPSLRKHIRLSLSILLTLCLRTGDLRFRLPQPIGPYNASNSETVTSFGAACPQQAMKLPILTGLAADAVNFITNSIFNAVLPSSEDCLTINVVTPSTATPQSKLPVVVVSLLNTRKENLLIKPL